MSNRARATAQRRTAAADRETNNLFGSSSSNGPRKSSKYYYANIDDGSGPYTTHSGAANSATSNHNHMADSHHSDSSSDPCGVTAHSTLLQPRVAVVLGVSKTWHPLLFLCRLLSIIPAVWWGLPSALRLLAMLHLMFIAGGPKAGGSGTGIGGSANGNGNGNTAMTYCDMPFEARLRLVETMLATLWCGASGYLSFFFTDCLMSRWLLNYTPQATLVRLLTTSALNTYLTSLVLWGTGGSADPRLLLPAWIAISTILTVLYHITQRKINIRKETSMSISVFSIASFVSMVALLAQLHSNRSDYPHTPLVALTRRVWHEALKLALAVMDYGNYGNLNGDIL